MQKFQYKGEKNIFSYHINQNYERKQHFIVFSEPVFQIYLTYII